MSKRPKIGRFRALGRYFKDPNAGILGKLVVVLAVAYVVFPYDLIPDVPFVGWLDDIGVMGLTTAWLSRVLGKYRALGGDAPAELGRGDALEGRR
jgi:uncharacterized membrane protein YkvA (DUF1232 family)